MEGWKRNKIQIDPLRETAFLHRDSPSEEFLEVTADMLITYSVDCVRIVNKAIDNMRQSPPEEHSLEG